MARICPILNERVVYLVCQDCDKTDCRYSQMYRSSDTEKEHEDQPDEKKQA